MPGSPCPRAELDLLTQDCVQGFLHGPAGQAPSRVGRFPPEPSSTSSRQVMLLFNFIFQLLYIQFYLVIILGVWEGNVIPCGSCQESSPGQEGLGLLPALQLEKVCPQGAMGWAHRTGRWSQLALRPSGLAPGPEHRGLDSGLALGSLPRGFLLSPCWHLGFFGPSLPRRSRAMVCWNWSGVLTPGRCVREEQAPRGEDVVGQQRLQAVVGGLWLAWAQFR